MLKKRTIALIIILLISFSNKSFAESVVNYDYYGTDNSISIFWATTTVQYRDQTFFSQAKIAGSGYGKIRWYSPDDTVLGEQILTSDTTIDFPTNEASGIKLFASDGEFHLVEAFSNNQIAPHIFFDENPPNDGTSNIVECQYWDEYMAKLDEIKAAIPPAPDWYVVADIFRDSIVPKMISDMRDMLGEAPEPPAEPAQLADLDTRGIENEIPVMNELPAELNNVQFSKDDIKNEAPVIEVRDDPTGGFNIVDPVESLPDFPTDDLPLPGQTNSGEWGENIPVEIENTFPVPEGQQVPDVVEAPIPSENTEIAPIPLNGEGVAPIPDQEGTLQGTMRYKSNPDDPDGSG